MKTTSRGVPEMVTQPNAIVLYPSATSAAPVHATYMGGWRSAMVAGVMMAMVATVAHVMSDCTRQRCGQRLKG